jgi:hypothetical protein
MGKEKSISIPVLTFNLYNRELVKSSYPLNKKKIRISNKISKLDSELDTRSKKDADLKRSILKGDLLKGDLTRLILNRELSGSFNLEAYALITNEYPVNNKYNPYQLFDAIVIGNRDRTNFQKKLSGKNQDFYRHINDNPHFRRNVIDTLSYHFCYIFNKYQKLLHQDKSKDGKQSEPIPHISYPHVPEQQFSNVGFSYIPRLDEKMFTKILNLNLLDSPNNTNQNESRDYGKIISSESKPLLLPVGISLTHPLSKLNEDFIPAYVASLNKRFKEGVEIPFFC